MILIGSGGFYVNPGPSNLSSKRKFAQIWAAGADGLSCTMMVNMIYQRSRTAEWKLKEDSSLSEKEVRKSIVGVAAAIAELLQQIINLIKLISN